jgi:hypothetical protein
MSFSFDCKKLHLRPETRRNGRRLVLSAAVSLPALRAVPAASAADVVWTPVVSARWLEQQGMRWLLRGEGPLRWFGLTLYQARLWSAETFEPMRWEHHGFALELIYARSLSGARIAEASLELMQAQRATREESTSRDATWLRLMRTSFPDVQAGDRIVGIYPGAQAGCRFVHNLRTTGETPDSDFARAFFAIWLDPKTREPGLRKALLSLT